MKINDDEFDYIFYTYGLRLYKDMPLIEPPEYKEVKTIREVVIAIGTSGPTSGEPVLRGVTTAEKTARTINAAERLNCPRKRREDVIPARWNDKDTERGVLFVWEKHSSSVL